jgi:DNA invertase Pin-like site-specific DNA recombinase
MIYGYLRVSSDKQDVESQKIGVVKKAKELNVTIDEWICESGVSGAKDYSERQLGELMHKAKSGDVIIVSEISRLARTVFMLFRIVEYCMNNDIIIYSVKDSISTIKKNDITGLMMVFCFGIAAQIEREMIIKRTNEGIERRRRDGVIFGRPIGSTSKKRKLTGRENEIIEYFQNEKRIGRVAKKLKVDRETLIKYCREKNIDIPNNPPPDITNSKHFTQGKLADSICENEREFITDLIIDNGLINREIVQKLNEKGHEITVCSFTRWIKGQKDLYDCYVERNNELRKIHNKDCGKQKKYYKF